MTLGARGFLFIGGIGIFNIDGISVPVIYCIGVLCGSGLLC